MFRTLTLIVFAFSAMTFSAIAAEQEHAPLQQVELSGPAVFSLPADEEKLGVIAADDTPNPYENKYNDILSIEPAGGKIDVTAPNSGFGEEIF